MACYLTVDRFVVDDIIDRVMLTELQDELFADWNDTPLECLPLPVRSELDRLVSAKIIQCINDTSGQESFLYPLKRHLGYFLQRYGIATSFVKKVIIHDTGIDLVLE
jgi:hypothetical protein